MVEHPAIEFPEKIEQYDVDRDVVLFPARTADGEITCAISGEALQDYFGARGASQRLRLTAFRAHRADIEAAARRKFEANQREGDNSVLVRSNDL